jgi:hypothetical protein
LPSLRELQARFVRALDGDAAAATGLLRDDGLPATERLAIYANNSRLTFRAALAATFPVTRRLGGDDWFAGAAGAYRAVHPSRSGDLQHAGERFAAFLATRLAGTPHEVLADVAALEWACECVGSAADGPPLDIATLAEVPPERHADLVFPLHPACRLLASRWPVVTVWTVHRAAGEPEAVDLDAGAQCALVCRRDEVEVHAVDAATHALLREFERGGTLDAAAARALQVDPGFALDAALARLATSGVFGPARLAAA